MKKRDRDLGILSEREAKDPSHMFCCGIEVELFLLLLVTGYISYTVLIFWPKNSMFLKIYDLLFIYLC